MEFILTDDELADYRAFIPVEPWLGYQHQPSADVSSFVAYPLQRGWSPASIQKLQRGDISDFDQSTILPMLQSWFLIGFIECAFMKPLPLDGFVVKEDEGTRLSMITLRSILTEFKERYESAKVDTSVRLERSVTLRHLHEVLETASLWNNRLCRDRWIEKNPSVFDTAAFASILRLFALLGTALQETARYARLLGGIPETLETDWFNCAAAEESLCARLLKRGWCPSMRWILKKTDLLVTEYAAIIGPSSTSIDHQGCSTKICSTHNIDDATYHVRHAEICSGCPEMRPSAEQLFNVLENSQFPVIGFRDSLQDGSSNILECAPYVDGLRFIAISHVWSGGLGSCSENGLPRCRLLEIVKYFSEIEGLDFFWIDSLCIPRDQQYRRLAIKRIDQVFASATATIVLDPQLKLTRISTPRKSLLWVITSAWMQRLWTFTEGHFSNIVAFAFIDGMATLKDLLEYANDNYTDPIVRAMAFELWELFREKEQIDWQAIQKSLRFRTTSKPRDEALALATLFRINPLPVFRDSGPDMMAPVWRAIKTVPSNIILLRGAKLSEAGLRWAPQSLLGLPGEVVLTRGRKEDPEYTAKICREGLRGVFNLLKLEKRDFFKPGYGGRSIKDMDTDIEYVVSKYDSDMNKCILRNIDAFAMFGDLPRENTPDSTYLPIIALTHEGYSKEYTNLNIYAYRYRFAIFVPATKRQQDEAPVIDFKSTRQEIIIS